MSTFAAISKLRAAIERANAVDAELKQASETLQHQIGRLRATRVCPTKNSPAPARRQSIQGNDDETLAEKDGQKTSCAQYTMDSENSTRDTDCPVANSSLSRPETQVNSKSLDGTQHSLLQAETDGQEIWGSGASGVISTSER